VLQRFRALRDELGMVSSTMGDLAPVEPREEPAARSSADVA
jgi:hypothetical protein